MPISAEASSCLSAAREGLKVTTDINFGAILGEIDVDRILDQTSDGHATGRFARTLTEHVLAWRRTATPRSKAMIAWASQLYSAEPMQELLWEVSGPIAEEYLRRNGFPTMSDIYGTALNRSPLAVSIPSAQSLRLPYLVHAVIAHKPNVRNYLQLLTEQHQRSVEALCDIDVDTFTLWYNRGIEAQRGGEGHRRITERKHVRQTRKAIRRGVRAMNTLIKPNAYGAFLSSDGLIIQGHLFDYRAAKSKVSIIDHTADPSSPHIPYDLQILDKTGAKLGRGCILFDQTPVLDQVIALTLHVRDQESELELLATANWSFQAVGRTNPDLLALFPEVINRPSLADLTFVGGPASGRFHAYRSHIMDAIAPNVEFTLSQLAKIPIPIYRMMSRPQQETTAESINRFLAALGQTRPG